MTKNQPERRSAIDPAVAALIAGMERISAEQRLPKKQRERKAAERAKMEARRPKRVTYDLPPVLRQRVKELAQKLSVPESQVVALALGLFFQDHDQKKIDFTPYKKASRSPRYDYQLTLPAEWLEEKEGKVKVKE